MKTIKVISKAGKSTGKDKKIMNVAFESDIESPSGSPLKKEYDICRVYKPPPDDDFDNYDAL